MKVVATDAFGTELDAVLDYIAQNNPNVAQEFKDALELKIDDLTFMPFKNKKSLYFDDENIRDMVYKGYTITYFIDEKNGYLVILGILKYKKDFVIKSRK
ncbi:MAG: type II toxin-antitoxin system RelE/ParE family toxin [Campylobacterota bacterium]